MINYLLQTFDTNSLIYFDFNCNQFFFVLSDKLLINKFLINQSIICQFNKIMILNHLINNFNRKSQFRTSEMILLLPN